MITSFLAGAAAGFGIAIPVGAIAILIVETGLRRGFRLAAAAGLGAAGADGIYAFAAAAFGAALAGLLAPYETPLRVLAIVLLVAIALRGLLGASRAQRTPATDDGAAMPADVEAAERGGSVLRTFGAFLGLTLLNPVTVTYFAALILGLAGTGVGPAEKAAFVAGAGLASLSWQELIAFIGSRLHRRLSPRTRAATAVLGNLVVIGLAVSIAIPLLTGAR